MIDILLNTSSTDLTQEYVKIINEYNPVFKLFRIKIVNKNLDIDVFDQYGCDDKKICIVSPGNSFGYLDGGFDKGILSLFDNNFHIEGGFQKIFHTELLLKNKSHYSPHLNATLLDFSKYGFISSNLSFTHVLHLSTMVSPELPLFIHSGNEEFQYYEKLRFVFNCCYNSLLKIQCGFSILNCIVIPGFGAGYGGIDNDICALGILVGLKFFEIQYLNKEIDVVLFQQMMLEFQGYKDLHIFNKNNPKQKNSTIQRNNHSSLIGEIFKHT